jgi:uncharacterized membrane protein
MVGSELRGGMAFTLLSRRSNSLSAAGRLLVFGSLAVVTLAISLAFAVHGAWLVVPFAGLECLGLYLAYRWLKRHESDYECITVDAERVIVDSSEGGTITRREFSRAWVQVVVNDGNDGHASICLRSHGRSVEIGKWLTDHARIEVARQLKQRISDDRTQHD